jgi:hypothetical protein
MQYRRNPCRCHVGIDVSEKSTTGGNLEYATNRQCRFGTPQNNNPLVANCAGRGPGAQRAMGMVGHARLMSLNRHAVDDRDGRNFW